MVQAIDNNQGVFRSLDKWTVFIYVALLVFGWISVCGASYTYGSTDIFSMGSRSGMQIVWIGTSLALGFVILMTDSRMYDTFAYVIYGVLLLLLFVTIFNPHEIKGSRSWLVLGPLRLQPAEFAKFATALAVSKLMSSYGFDIHRWRHFAMAIGVVVLPMLFIVGQKETGSALVYLSFFLMFYREGMQGSILFSGVAMVIYFVVGIKYENVMLMDTPTSVGKYVVLLLAQIFTTGMVASYCKSPKTVRIMAIAVASTTLIATLAARFIVAFDIVWIQLATIVAMAIAWNSNSTIFSITSFAWAGFGAAFGPLMLFSLFWKRTTRAGAVAGMLAGGAMVFIWKLAIKPLGGVFAVYELLPAFVFSAVVIVIVSLCTKKPDAAVEEEFERVKAGQV